MRQSRSHCYGGGGQISCQNSIANKHGCGIHSSLNYGFRHHYAAFILAAGVRSPPVVQQTIQDLLVEERLLFSIKTDERLRTLKDSRVTLKGIYTLVTKREPFCPQLSQWFQPFLPHTPDLSKKRSRSYKRHPPPSSAAAPSSCRQTGFSEQSF